MSKNGKVLVAMSGGVDSSVAALLLYENGYEVVGITLKMWEYHSNNKHNKTTCCNIDSINDARTVAVKMGFPHYVVDVSEMFSNKIIQYFIQEYLKGYTPNPCVLCNSQIKWNILLEKAKQLDCSFVATGHYAKVNQLNNRYFISMGDDPEKDQSYVLWTLTQEHLKKTLLPLGNYDKKQIKDIAQKAGFVDISKKKESYEICFIPDNNYREFIFSKVDNIERGKFVDIKGNTLGTHKGLPFYTIGQRKGLGIPYKEPLYVKEIIPEKNEIILASRSEVYSSYVKAKSIIFSKYENIPEKIQLSAKVRYKNSLHSIKTIEVRDNILTAYFNEPVFAITPGQSVVFYENSDIVCGGIITK